MLPVEIDGFDIDPRAHWPLMDNSGQRAELSAEDAATGPEAYREGFVAPKERRCDSTTPEFSSPPTDIGTWRGILLVGEDCHKEQPKRKVNTV